MNITGLNKAEILSVLYNNAKVQGKGFLRTIPGNISLIEAQSILDSGQEYFEYLHRRVMEVSLSNDEVDTWGYNRDNGENAVSSIR